MELTDRIKEILYQYVSVQSVSPTEGERAAGEFFLRFIEGIPYFHGRPGQYGAWPVEGDPLGRFVAWALLRGRGNGTVVLMHHFDVAGTEDFHTLKDAAFSPDELESRLLAVKDSLAPDARADLESGEYLFGHGACDMKGGGSIQLALLEKYARDGDFCGNLIVIGLPDEENLSAGMAAAVPLLSWLQDTFGLDYKLMVNSEPHQRRTPEKGVFSAGSIGKMMPFLYVRGFLAHASQIFRGFNPVSVLSRAVAETEASFKFSDSCGGEVAPPPTWLFMKDSKAHYDVSMPLSAYGFFSVLTMTRAPADILGAFRAVARAAFEAAIAALNDSYREVCEASGQKFAPLPWKPLVLSTGELLEQVKAALGAGFEPAYREMTQRLAEAKASGASMIEMNRMMVEWLCDNRGDLAPCAVYGLVPPYYPHVANSRLKGADGKILRLPSLLSEYSEREFGQPYECENYYTGISDLSYSSLSDAGGTRAVLEQNMGLWGVAYSLPLEEMEKISMPCVNIGPWGKEFHKMTERVLKEDLYERTPRLLDLAVKLALGQR